MRARVKILRSLSVVEDKGGVEAWRRSEVRIRRSLPGVMAEVGGARRRKRRVSVGMRPAERVWVCVYFPRRWRADDIPAVSLEWRAVRVSADARMTVGAMELVARVRSTPGSAREVRARLAWV